MDRIFDDAKDKNVRFTVMYADADDGNLFTDSAHTSTNKIAMDDVKEAFMKGALVVLSSAYYAIAKYAEGTNSDSTKYAVVTVCADGAEYNFYSKEYVAPAAG